MNATWKKLPETADFRPHFEAEGIGVFCLGEKGEYIVSFQNITPEQLIALTYEYEKTVEQFDSRAEYDEEYDTGQVQIGSCYLHTDDNGEWRAYWGPLNDEYPVKDRLVIRLNRW